MWSKSNYEKMCLHEHILSWNHVTISIFLSSMLIENIFLYPSHMHWGHVYHIILEHANVQQHIACYTVGFSWSLKNQKSLNFISMTPHSMVKDYLIHHVWIIITLPNKPMWKLITISHKGNLTMMSSCSTKPWSQTSLHQLHESFHPFSVQGHTF